MKKQEKQITKTQGIAYSLDGGDSWEMYAENPVIGNSGVKDFRDPKVFWNEKTNAWTMLLVAGDHLQIWGSNNLIDWEKQSEFGKKTRGPTGVFGSVQTCFLLQIKPLEQKSGCCLLALTRALPMEGVAHSIL